MRKVLALVALSVLLLVTGVLTAQAQIRDLNDRGVFPDRGIIIGLPDDDELVTLCHIPPGNPPNAHTIEVEQQDAAAHLAHGDLPGECPYECDGPPSPVPQTGQTECWGPAGNPISCTGSCQDGEYQCGVSVDPRFTDNGDGTVTDNLTELIWLKYANCFGFRSWLYALSDADALADGFCGLTDGSIPGYWRLPNVKELQSLIDYGEWGPVLPYGHPFYAVQIYPYWSSTTWGGPGYAWRVHLHNGFVSYEEKWGIGNVWPVRGGQ
jgi:hypothetical protein